MTVNVTREEIHRIIDEIPESQLPTVLSYLKRFTDASDDPVQRALANAPVDDEPQTEEEQRAVQEGKADVRLGRTLSTDTLKRELGL